MAGLKNITMGRMIAATPRILPAVYEDAMTYLEQLRILNDKLNEVIDVFNSYGDELLTESKDYTDQQFLILQKDMNDTLSQFRQELDNGLDDLDATLTAELAQFRERAEAEFAWFHQRADELFDMFVEETTKLNENINRLQIAVNTLFDALSRTKLEMREEMQSELSKIVTWMQNAMAAKTGEQIIVQNPVSRTLTTLNVALKSITFVLKGMFSLTANEYKSLHLTVEEYKALQISANNYLYKARWIFFDRLYFPELDKRFGNVYDYINHEVEALNKNHYMVSPFDGVVTPINNVVYELAQLHMDGITADQYREALLTADAYRDKQISAYDYAWNGFYLIYTDAVPKETLQEQVAELQKALAEAVQRIQALENESTPSSTIADMKTDIQKNRNDISDVRSFAEQTENEVKQVERNMQQMSGNLSQHFQNEIDGLNSTLSTVDAGLQSQIASVKNGLDSIHIHYA